jgi:hypothetical protein
MSPTRWSRLSARTAALTLKSILALYLVGIGVFAPRSRFVRAALCLAIVAGTVGAVSTLGALG